MLKVLDKLNQHDMGLTNSFFRCLIDYKTDEE